METAQRRVVSCDINYEVDEYGRIYRGGKEVKSFPSGGDYLSVVLCSEGVTKHQQVSRLVAIAFVSNPHNYKFVDHIDRDRRNNHYTNLRWVTKRMNKTNSSKIKGLGRRKPTSKYIGVSKCVKSGKWRARIAPHNRKEIALGRFDTEEEAAEAYNIKALEVFGEHANINVFDD